MTGIEASTFPPPLPRWFGPRASPDDPAVSALIGWVARGAGWADIGGGFNLNVQIDAEPPVVLRVHRPWVRRGRVAGLRRLRERLQRTQVRVARHPRAVKLQALAHFARSENQGATQLELPWFPRS